MANNVIEIVLKAVDQATEPLKGVSKALGGIKGLIGGAVAGLGLKEFVDNIVEAQKESFQLENAIRAVGKSAGTTFEEMDALAESVQKTTQFSQGAAQSAEALALRLGLTGDTIQRLVKDSADLAAATGGDLVSAMEQLSRAVADPERGMLSLRRAGIILTQQQQYVIEKLAKTGEAAKAQNILLAAVEDRYKNAASEARNTLGGALDALKNNFKSLFEATSGDTSSFTKFINEASVGLVHLKEAFHGTLKDVDEVSTGMKLFASSLLIVKGLVENVATTIKTVLVSAFQVAGKYLGGMAAAQVEFVKGHFKEAGSILKEVFADIFKSTKDNLNAGGNKIEDDTSLTIEKIIKLWDEGARDIKDAQDKATRGGRAKAAPGFSADQLKAIDQVFDQLKAKSQQLKVQATAPLNDMAGALEEVSVKAVLARLNIVKIGDDTSKLPKKIRAALEEFRQDNAAAAQRGVLVNLQDQTAELEQQAKLHGQALQDALDNLQIQNELRNASAQTTAEIQKQQAQNRGKRDNTVLSDLQDQLNLARLTGDELERETNLRRLSADATDGQKQNVIQLTDEIIHARNVTSTWSSVLGDVKDAFGKMVENGKLSIKDLIRTMLIEFAKRDIFEAIDRIGSAFKKSFSQSSGGGILSTIGHAIFGFAGGGHPKGLALVGENGPELANFGSGGQVWNKSELAFAGAGGGISYAPQTTIMIEAKDTDANTLRKEFYSVIALNNAKQEKSFQQTLRDNGFGRLR